MTTDSLATNKAAIAGGVVGGMFATFAILGLAFYILFVIAGWKMFEKAGEKGWKVLIPLYNAYILFKIVGMKNWFWALFAVSLVASVALSIIAPQGAYAPNAINLSTSAGIPALILIIAACIFDLCISIMYAVRTSKAFGHGAWFAVGLFFLSDIFMLILGFGKSKYDKKLVASWEKK